MIVQNLFIYPIKSCGGIEVNQVSVEAKGFYGDREFMLVDYQGKFITQRQAPKLAIVEARFQNNLLELRAENTKAISFEPTFNGRDIEVEIWRDRTVGIDQGDEVAHWFQSALGLNGCRLVRQSPKYIRTIDPFYAESEDKPVSFADGYPCLLVGTASLMQLNEKLIAAYGDESIAINMNRFRPNLVVETTEPFVEDNWKQLKIGGLRFANVKPCSRCIITTTDQVTGERNHLQEPLKTLVSFRHFQGGVMFGENLIPLNTGEIRVGDIIEVLS